MFATAFELKAHQVAVHLQDKKLSRREREQMSRIDHLLFMPSGVCVASLLGVVLFGVCVRSGVSLMCWYV